MDNLKEAKQLLLEAENDLRLMNLIAPNVPIIEEAMCKILSARAFVESEINSVLIP